jgi:putative Ca2+/H+ antiporter (TMEM165/GDT1 family)
MRRLVLVLALLFACVFGQSDDKPLEKTSVSKWDVSLKGFVASLSMTIAAELGDKTFFIAAILGMRNPQFVVLSGALSALLLMTILSAGMGFALPALLPKLYTHLASIFLFLFFGVKLIRDALNMREDEPNSELEEVELKLGVSPKESVHDLEENPEDKDKKGDKKAAAPVMGGSWVHPVMIQAFTMTFLAEWGDRSQITTIALAADGDPIGVTIGGFLGHSICTALAVFGGKMLAARISEKTVALVGGVLFLIFGVHAIWAGP